MKFRLEDAEHKKLVELYLKAQTTPMIYTGGTKDWAALAWDDVRSYMDALGAKYGYDPETARISMKSPEFEAEGVAKPN